MQLTITDQASAVLNTLGAKLAHQQPVYEAAALAIASLTQRSFVDASVRAVPWIPLDPSTIKGKRREPSIDMILAILGELGLKNINIGTNGTIVDGHQNTELVPIPASAIRMVPLISWVQAGGFCTTEQPELPADDYEAYACPNPKAGPRTFALKVRGDSMTNAIGGGRSYPEGTIIFVDPDHPASAGQRVVACLEDGGCTFKELAENEMGRQYLRAINPRYTISDHDHPAKICGVVIGSYLPE